MAPLPVVRFAPSPTGRIHIGNARTALFNWLFARTARGTFMLRFDDTDLARSTTEYADAIEADLAWLGIRPDLVAPQSERLAPMTRRPTRLQGAGGSTRPTRRRRSSTAGASGSRRRGLPPIYDRAALTLTAAERAALEAEGRKPHWRFLLEPTTGRAGTTWCAASSHIDCASLSDPVLAREDGSYLYTLPSVVDDIDFGVTHVIRGEDHVTNTAVQIQIFEALGGASPRFGHHNLLTDAGGEGLSKRTGALSIAACATKGIEPMAVAALAVLVGSSRRCARSPRSTNWRELTDLSQLSPRRGPVRRGRARGALGAHAASPALRGGRGPARGARYRRARAEAFWLAVRGNLATSRRCGDLAASDRGRGQADRRGRRVSDAAPLRAPPRGRGTRRPGARWTTQLKDRSGRKGRALFHPLRLALTGRKRDPNSPRCCR